MICDVCGCACLPVTEKPLESILWIRAPTGIDALINPVMWIILSEKFKEGSVNVLEWLTNPRLTIPPADKPKAIKKLEVLGVKRGLNNFIRNFDEIFNIIITKRIIKKLNPYAREKLVEFIAANRNNIFSSRLPVPSKLAMITEKTPMGGYADPLMRSALNAIWTINAVENPLTPISDKVREEKTVKCIAFLADYYNRFTGPPLGQKPGWLRQNVYGSRSHFTFRSVIASINEPHNLEEIHIPWSLAVMLFEIDLISKMNKLPRERLIQYGINKHGFTPNMVLRYIQEHTLQYSKLLDDMLDELLAEGPGGTIKILLQRNPTLTIGSIQMLKNY